LSDIAASKRNSLDLVEGEFILATCPVEAVLFSLP